MDGDIGSALLAIDGSFSPAAERSGSARPAAAPARPSPSRIAGAYEVLRGGAQRARLASRSRDRSTFDDRRRHAGVLVCVLAGYKHELWPFVLPALSAALPPDADVCVVSPGLVHPALRERCRTEGWSYLGTGLNDVSLAQNVCFRLHPDAALIVKVDEDMLLLPETLTRLLDEYQAIKAEGVMDPGLVAPLIPLNGFCYRHVLERLDLLGAYQRRFGPARLAASGIPVQADPAAARWIWEHTAPLRPTAARLTAGSPERFACPIRFSIGTIVFERRFWEEIEFLPVRRHRLAAGLSTLGGDEAHLCSKAVELSRPCVVTTAALAGHFSFGPQHASMRGMLAERPELFRP